MKKITKISLGTLLFVILFYKQDIGLNTAIFAMVVWLLSYQNLSKNKKSNLFWTLSFFVFLSGFSFTWYGDEFSFFALFFSILLFGIQSQYPRINILLFPILWFINYATFIFRVFIFKYWVPKKNPQNKLWKRLLAFFLIPGVFVLLFIIIYASASDIFYSILQKLSINLNFFIIIFLTFFSFIFLFNLWSMFIPKGIIRLNSLLKNDFEKEKHQQLKQTFSILEIDLERRSGEVTLILLNLLLLIFIIIYNYEQFFSSAETVALSAEVHQRIATIIFSIAMAIILVMFYFKSSFNFDKKAGRLKRLAFVWIILNAILILVAFIKNSEYIANYGLTYKRIGVHIFLSLSLVGLWLTYFKIKYQKTNIFLLNKMTWVFVVTLIVTSWINFSWIVTKYNIVFNKNNDIEYLQNLNFNKKILYNTYKDNPLWKQYFANQKEVINREQNKEFLSSKLYFYWLDLNK
ncbi:MAG: DUF4173 domain-containing protein [Ginsengibacter sp.]